MGKLYHNISNISETLALQTAHIPHNIYACVNINIAAIAAANLENNAFE